MNRISLRTINYRLHKFDGFDVAQSGQAIAGKRHAIAYEVPAAAAGQQTCAQYAILKTSFRDADESATVEMTIGKHRGANLVRNAIDRGGIDS